jgi:hypothetical protein
LTIFYLLLIFQHSFLIALVLINIAAPRTICNDKPQRKEKAFSTKRFFGKNWIPAFAGMTNVVSATGNKIVFFYLDLSSFV